MECPGQSRSHVVVLTSELTQVRTRISWQEQEVPMLPHVAGGPRCSFHLLVAVEVTARLPLSLLRYREHSKFVFLTLNSPAHIRALPNIASTFLPRLNSYGTRQ
jgi:hypothetical protein